MSIQTILFKMSIVAFYHLLKNLNINLGEQMEKPYNFIISAEWRIVDFYHFIYFEGDSLFTGKRYF
jgi:hypothetical protein